MATTRELLYAVIGAGDLAVEKAMNLPTIVDRDATRQMYSDLVKRGRSLSNRIKSSAATKEATSQTRAARRQVKAAATSVTKAVRANARATRSAAEKAAAAS